MCLHVGGVASAAQGGAGPHLNPSMHRRETFWVGTRLLASSRCRLLKCALACTLTCSQVHHLVCMHACMHACMRMLRSPRVLPPRTRSLLFVCRTLPNLGTGASVMAAPPRVSCAGTGPSTATPAALLLRLCDLCTPDILTLERRLCALGDPFAAHAHEREAWVAAYQCDLSAVQRSRLFWAAACHEPSGPNAVGLMLAQLGSQRGLSEVMPCSGTVGLMDSLFRKLAALASDLFRMLVNAAAAGGSAAPPQSTDANPVDARVAAVSGYDAGTLLIGLLRWSPRLCAELGDADGDGAECSACPLRRLAAVALAAWDPDRWHRVDPLLSGLTAGVMVLILTNRFSTLLAGIAGAPGLEPGVAVAVPLPCDEFKALVVSCPDCVSIGYRERMRSMYVHSESQTPTRGPRQAMRKQAGIERREDRTRKGRERQTQMRSKEKGCKKR